MPHRYVAVETVAASLHRADPRAAAQIAGGHISSTTRGRWWSITTGYRYTQFCEIYRQWARRLRPSMRQVHRAGEKTFIDFSGKRPPGGLWIHRF